MNSSTVISPADVDFWMDSNKYFNFLDSDNSVNGTVVFNIDMVKLSSIRKSISNFVRILTRRSIPVYFNEMNANVNFNGKLIYISAKINSKHDFDVAVGQALHEGAHSLETDFDIVKCAWANIPPQILKLSDSKNIRRSSLEKFIHQMWNIIEDRYIDNYVFNEAPGYRGYYVALYDRFWNCPEIDSFLISDLHRFPSLDSYSFRITNFTNLNTDLLALPRLEDIAKVIDITNINRLKTTKDRVETAFKVTEIVLECLDNSVELEKIKSKKGSNSQSTKLADPSDYFDFGDGDDGEESESNKGENPSDKEVDVGDKMIDEMADVLGERDSEPEKLKENSDIVNKISGEDGIDPDLKKQIKNVVESQRKFLSGEFPKEAVTQSQKALLDLIEKHGIILVQVDVPQFKSGDDKNLKIDCIVVNKMTKELILSGQDIFPLAGAMKLGNDLPCPPKSGADAVKDGIAIGTKLGRKLQIRSEINPIKIVRRRSGKINRRQIHEAAFDAEDFFYNMKIDDYHHSTLHITVDASSSMSGKKWLKTMTAVVAICKATSMIDNIHVTVSFRTTQDSGTTTLPYIVLAYDSKHDKFSKIRNLFPYLIPNGLTPEGLAFGAIMNLFEGITPDEKDRYFLNFSDGEPYYHLRIPSNGITLSYSDEVGVTHTKAQVDKIRRCGVDILSYFIEDDTSSVNSLLRLPKSKETKEGVLHKNFSKMYGKNAKFLDVNSVTDLARTMNDLFLCKLKKY